MSSVGKNFFILISLVAACGCGRDKDEKACVEHCPGSGFVVKADSKEVPIEFPASGDYIVMPFILGNIDAINNATGAEDAGTFSLSSVGNAASLQRFSKKIKAFSGNQPISREMSAREFDQNIRTLHNHFSPRLGENQTGGFWELARRLDQYKNPTSFNKTKRAGGSIEQRFRNRIAEYNKTKNQKILAHTNLVSTTDGCSVDGTIQVPELGAISPDLITVDHNDSSYCLLFVKSDPISEPSKKAIRKNIGTLLSLYKEVIYKDKFDFDTGYLFKPLVVVLPMDDGSLWPQTKDYRFSGAFSKALTETHERPTFFMAADLTKVGESKSNARVLFHSTLAHEMQHAIINYFRYWKQGDEDENIIIDEGMAHFFEDVMGYGEVNFENFAKPYLMSFVDLSDPVLGEIGSPVSASVRGGAQTFIYFLSSKLGGVDFAKGVVDGGEGIGFIRSFVKGETPGVGGLRDAIKEDWVSTVGNYFGAMVLDGEDTMTIAEDLKVQDPVEAVTDSAGLSTERIFGMHFNNFRELAKPSEEFSSYAEAASLDSDQALDYYDTVPFLYSGASGALTVTFGKKYDNAGVAVVRVR